MAQRIWLVLALGAVTAFAACGGGGAETEGEAEADVTAGGEDDLAADASATEGGAAGEGATREGPDAAEGEGAAGEEGAGGEGGEATAEGEATEGGEAADPEEQWRAKVRVGRQWFNRACGTCHPGGDEDLGPRIIGKNLPVARMRHQIRNGTGRMRPIPPQRLPDRVMDELMAYLSTIRAVRGVERP